MYSAIFLYFQGYIFSFPLVTVCNWYFLKFQLIISWVFFNSFVVVHIIVLKQQIENHTVQPF